MRSASAFSTVNPGVFKASEYILWYAKNKKQLQENRVRVACNPDKAYDKWLVNPDDHYSTWTFISLYDAFKLQNSDTIDYDEKNKIDKIVNEYNNFIVKNASQVVRFASIDNKKAAKSIVEIKKISLLETDKVFHIKREKYDDIFIMNGQQIIFYSKNVYVIDGKLQSSKILTNIWDDVAWEGIAQEGKVTLRKGKKPEKLIKRILEIITQENDLVLDFYLGSGTTAAVAHKMGRRYIGIEQMDYINDITVPRLQKVIEGEQGGISKDVNWQGGGSFVYTELKKLNYVFVDAIKKAKNYEELCQIFESMKTGAYLNYQVELDEVLNTHYEVDGIDHKIGFKELSLDEQKRLLIELLDKNQLYVNASEMDDTTLDISENDKAFTKSFYQEG